MATCWENSCSFGLRYVSWYKYLIVILVFSRSRFLEWESFLIVPFPDRCLLVPFCNSYKIVFFTVRSASCNVNPSEDCVGIEYSMTWLAFSNSSTGFLNVTHLLPNGTCGFNYPMWIKGELQIVLLSYLHTSLL